MSEKINTPNYETLPIDCDLRLQQLSVSDQDTLFKLVNSNRDYLAQWLPWVDATQSPSDSAEFIESTLADRASGAAFQYGIIENDKIIGHAGLMHVSDNQSPEIGYWIAQDQSGRGITSKVATKLANFALDTLGLDEVVIKAEPDNIASNKIAENLGFSLSGEDVLYGATVNVWTRTEPITV